MHKLLLSTALLAAIGAGPANAALQLSITDGTTTFSCKDGQLSCDLSGGANNLLTVGTTLDGFFVQVTLTQSTFGSHNVLQLSSTNIDNNGALPGTISFVASDTGFTAPVNSIEESASLTFNQNIGAAPSSISFFADPLNAQGANPLNTPGTLLDTVSGAAATDPDSFSGSKLALRQWVAIQYDGVRTLALNAGGSITGFDQSMTSSAIPEPSTWAMLIAGFGLLALFGVRRRKDRLPILTQAEAPMDKLLLASAFALAFGAAPAHAVTAVFCGPAHESSGACESGVEQKVFLNEEHDKTTGSGNVGSQKGPLFLFTVDTGAVDVDVDTGGGFANITAANGTGFKAFNGIDIKIPGFTFTDIVFDVQLAGPGGDTPETFTISPFSGLHVSDGIGTESDIQDDKDTEFSARAVGGVFDEVDIKAGALGFDEIKHIEISGLAALATPEPSTWAMLIAGFSLMGFLGFRRRWTAAV